MAARTPPSGPQSSLSTPRVVVSPWLVLMVVALGFFMIVLDTTIVNVAIPSMIDGLHATLDQILWVLNAYILVYAVLLITAGRLGDMFGPKKMYLTGLVIFTLSSAACGLAQDPNQLIFFRVMQGVGGAILTPQSLSIITSIFPPEQRGSAFGAWAGVAGLAAVTGPTLGGFLTTTFSWRAIFYVNVPIGIVTVFLVVLMMPEVTIHRRHHLDLAGIALASAGLFLGIFALIEGQRYSWGPIWSLARFSIGPVHASLVSIPTMLLGSIILLTLFVMGETKAEEPVLPLSLFRDRNFCLANVISAIVAFGMLGLFLPLTIFLQSVLGLSAEQAGIALVPTSLTSMVISPFMGRLADRISAKWILCTGLVLYATGMGLVIWVASLKASGGTFAIPLVIAGAGMGCTFAPMVTLAMRNIAPSQAGAASGFINTIRQVGGTLGSSVVGAVLQHQLATNMSVEGRRHAPSLSAYLAAAHIPAGQAAGIVGGFIQSLSHVSSSGFHLGRGQSGGSSAVGGHLPAAVAQHLAQVGHLVFQQAYLDAMKPSLALPIVVIATGAVVTLFMQTSVPAGASEETAPSRGGVAAAGE